MDKIKKISGGYRRNQTEIPNSLVDMDEIRMEDTFCDGNFPVDMNGAVAWQDRHQHPLSASAAAAAAN